MISPVSILVVCTCGQKNRLIPGKPGARCGACKHPFANVEGVHIDATFDCPFCRLDFSVVRAIPSGYTGLTHLDPPCPEFQGMNPLDFITLVRVIAEGNQSPGSQSN